LIEEFSGSLLAGISTLIMDPRMLKRGLEEVREPYRSIVAKLLEGLLDRFGERLISLIVYGSVARGDFRADSDLDLLIVIDGLPGSRLERQRMLLEVEEESSLRSFLEDLWNRGVNVDLSPIIITPAEASRIRPIYLDMVEDSIIVHDKDGFFERILERLRDALERLGAERIWVGRKWYWRLKKDYRPGEVIEIE